MNRNKFCEEVRDLFRKYVCPVDNCPFTEDVQGNPIPRERFPVILSSCHSCRAISVFESLRSDIREVEEIERIEQKS